MVGDYPRSSEIILSRYGFFQLSSSATLAASLLIANGLLLSRITVEYENQRVRGN